MRLIHARLAHKSTFLYRSTLFFSPAHSNPQSGPLAQAYVLYLVAAALRSNSVRSIGQIDTAPYDHIKLALKKAVQVLAKVTPRGLALTFDKALHKEICLVNFGECWHNKEIGPAIGHANDLQLDFRNRYCGSMRKPQKLPFRILFVFFSTKST